MLLCVTLCNPGKFIYQARLGFLYFVLSTPSELNLCLLTSDPGVKSHRSTLLIAIPDPERPNPSHGHDLHPTIGAESPRSMKQNKRPLDLGWVENYVGIPPYPGTPGFFNPKSSRYDWDNSGNNSVFYDPKQ